MGLVSPVEATMVRAGVYEFATNEQFLTMPE